MYITTVRYGTICKHSFTTLIATGGQLHTMSLSINTFTQDSIRFIKITLLLYLITYWILLFHALIAISYLTKCKTISFLYEYVLIKTFQLLSILHQFFTCISLMHSYLCLVNGKICFSTFCDSFKCSLWQSPYLLAIWIFALQREYVFICELKR